MLTPGTVGDSTALVRAVIRSSPELFRRWQEQGESVVNDPVFSEALHDYTVARADWSEIAKALKPR